MKEQLRDCLMKLRESLALKRKDPNPHKRTTENPLAQYQGKSLTGSRFGCFLLISSVSDFGHYQKNGKLQ